MHANNFLKMQIFFSSKLLKQRDFQVFSVSFLSSNMYNMCKCIYCFLRVLMKISLPLKQEGDETNPSNGLGCVPIWAVLLAASVAGEQQQLCTFTS